MRVCLTICLCLFPLLAVAQTPLTDDQRMAAREAAELRVEQDMVRMTSLVEALAKNLGQLHHLRTLCFGVDDQHWREYMTQMLEVEAPGDIDKQREMTQAFNAGFYQEQRRHKTCSMAVSADVAALSENGRSVSTMLGDPYREIAE